MPKLTKSLLDKAEVRDRTYTIWCSELKGLGAFVAPSGTRTYFVDYRNANGTRRRMKLGRHGTITADQARTLAITAMADVAHGKDPMAERNEARRAMSVKELCERYIYELDHNRILGKRGRPKKASTCKTDIGRIRQHIIPLIGGRPVNQLTKAEVTAMMKDVMTGRTRRNVKTGKLRGRSIVKGGPGTATRTVGLLGGILTYAKDELGIIAVNPAHGIRKPKDAVRTRRLNEEEYRKLGQMLREAAEDETYKSTAEMIRLIALTGCRRGEIIALKWSEVDDVGSCLRLEDSKEGQSLRPAGLAVLEAIDGRRILEGYSPYIFPGREIDTPFGSLPNHWDKIFKNSDLADVTPHVLRHSFASMANDLGFTEITIAALLGHASGSMTSRYIHSLDAALVVAADTVAGYIQALMDGAKLVRHSYPLDRKSRKAAVARFLESAAGDESDPSAPVQAEVPQVRPQVPKIDHVGWEHWDRLTT